MPQKIYIICPDTRHPSGGVKQLFRMTDYLNELGYDAYLVRKSKLKKVTWFQHSTKIAYFPYLYYLISKIAIKNRDLSKFKYKLENMFQFNKSLPEPDSIIVYPEIYGPRIERLLPENKFVIFNQNCFLTYNLYQYDSAECDPYHSRNMLAGITVSEDSQRYLSFAYSSNKFYRLTLGLKEVFGLSDVPKKKQIAFMPRKLQDDSNQIFNLLKARKSLSDWEIVAIDGMKEDDVALVLKQSSIFLSFNHKEGFGLPPLEAMACGCYVIGYAGFGGTEYFQPEFASKIVDGDIVAYVKEIERIIELYDKSPKDILALGQKASNYVRKHYNLANEKEDVRLIWEDILKDINASS